MCDQYIEIAVDYVALVLSPWCHTESDRRKNDNKKESILIRQVEVKYFPETQIIYELCPICFL